MSRSIRQQIVISGVGGQGVIFITRLLAEAAIANRLSVFTSETHGMAQRGGTVISHLKVGDFSSPLIRPFTADAMLALKAEGIVQHGFYLKPDSWAVVNSPKHITPEFNGSVLTIDADGMAQKIKDPKSVNLILLGFALAVVSKRYESPFFCSLEDIKTVLENQMVDKEKWLNASLTAIETGHDFGLKAKF